MNSEKIDQIIFIKASQDFQIITISRLRTSLAMKSQALPNMVWVGGTSISGYYTGRETFILMSYIVIIKG